MAVSFKHSKFNWEADNDSDTNELGTEETLESIPLSLSVSVLAFFVRILLII